MLPFKDLTDRKIHSYNSCGSFGVDDEGDFSKIISRAQKKGFVAIDDDIGDSIN